MPLPILTELKNKQHFQQLLETNPGALIIKFGAEWCSPCKQIEPHVHAIMEKLPDQIQSMIIDVDEWFEVYAFLKSKKMVNGIPVILCYYKGNVSYIPDEVVIGANIPQINYLFQTAIEHVALSK
jgi:thiol-disulfide isomerase/thioredoxin